jgi:hypothetical protein
MTKQEIGMAPQGVMNRWTECLLGAQSLPTYVCVRLARRRQRRGDNYGGSVEAIAASELFDIAFEGEPILRSVEKQLQPVLERLKAADLAIKLLGDE